MFCILFFTIFGVDFNLWESSMSEILALLTISAKISESSLSNLLFTISPANVVGFPNPFVKYILGYCFTSSRASPYSFTIILLNLIISKQIFKNKVNKALNLMCLYLILSFVFLIFILTSNYLIILFSVLILFIYVLTLKWNIMM